MTPLEYATAIRSDTDRLIEAARLIGFDEPVPTCPGWRVREVSLHLGKVHRWATRYVVERLAQMVDEESETAMISSGPDDSELLAWLRQGASELAAALEAADPELRCWTFLPADSPRAFWARRQAHETAIHRADLELAAGRLEPFASEFAADGIDEILMGFAYRGRRHNRAPVGMEVVLRAIDHPVSWRLSVGPDGMTIGTGSANGDCLVTATASDLYLLRWNRGDSRQLQADGDPAILSWWREHFKITWG